MFQLTTKRMQRLRQILHFQLSYTQFCLISQVTELTNAAVLVRLNVILEIEERWIMTDRGEERLWNKVASNFVDQAPSSLHAHNPMCVVLLALSPRWNIEFFLFFFFFFFFTPENRAHRLRTLRNEHVLDSTRARESSRGEWEKRKGKKREKAER